jgi:hypothetical protein
VGGPRRPRHMRDRVTSLWRTGATAARRVSDTLQTMRPELSRSHRGSLVEHSGKQGFAPPANGPARQSERSDSRSRAPARDELRAPAPVARSLLLSPNSTRASRSPSACPPSSGGTGVQRVDGGVAVLARDRLGPTAGSTDERVPPGPAVGAAGFPQDLAAQFGRVGFARGPSRVCSDRSTGSGDVDLHLARGAAASCAALIVVGHGHGRPPSASEPAGPAQAPERWLLSRRSSDVASSTSSRVRRLIVGSSAIALMRIRLAPSNRVLAPRVVASNGFRGTSTRRRGDERTAGRAATSREFPFEPLKEQTGYASLPL